GIRTHGGLAPTAVFKTAALNHSATLPVRSSLPPPADFCKRPAKKSRSSLPISAEIDAFSRICADTPASPQDLAGRRIPALQACHAPPKNGAGKVAD
ncbi:MAG: hypothetical protein DI537_31950, partial [Stutzerimonas stutzeri]